MIRILSNADRLHAPELFLQMFSGRASVFSNRLGWSVDVKDGLEADHLDTEGKPVYVIATDHAGSVVGSLRILPGSGPALLKSGFGQQFVPPPDLETGNVWECSRFCVHSQDGTERRISSYLLEGLCEYALSNGIGSIVGFFDRPMRRIYYRLGWSPEIIAESELQEELVVGRWSVTSAALKSIRERRMRSMEGLVTQQKKSSQDEGYSTM